MDEMQNILKNFISNNNIENNINNAYNNIINFDKTISSAASIIITNFINNKKMILNFYNFMYLFITSAYLIVWLCILIFFIVFECKKYKCLYYFILGFINLLVIISIWEIVLSGLFQGIRLYCRESPRVMKFLFTEDYIINGNTDNYPPKFGNKDPIQSELFSICLNGDGNLFQKFISKDTINSLLTQTINIKTISNNLYNIINNETNSANTITNSYNIYNNYSYIYSSILKLEEMYNNLYVLSDNFGDDNIRNITKYIRNNLDDPTCGKTYEYFVIKKSDCPKYSFVRNEITNSNENIYHCYIIQDLLSGSKASYSGSGCDNDYINKAISFIKEISNLLKNRINQLKEIQNNYILTWNNIYSEITSIKNQLSNIQNLLNDEINNKYIMGNCSSVKFDLIDFSEFISDSIGYKIKIMIIFAALSGIFGFILFYCILLILNQIKADNYFNYKNNNYEIYLDNNYSKINKYSKYRNIKPPTILKSDDEYQNKYKNKLSDIENKKEKNNKHNLSLDTKDINMNKNNNVIYNNIRKIEMRNLENKNKYY